jgi:tetratricopeptide (TPR) repeat protein
LDEQIRVKPEDAQAHANRGYARAVLGQKTAARTDLRRAVELNNTAPMLNQVGWAYFNMGDAKEALRVWKLAADLSKGNARYDYYSLALGYWANGDLARALENYDLAAKRDERFAEWKSLIERTGEWTDTEKREIQAIYSLWSKAWRPAN